MPLVKSPVSTAARIAANRANAKKSTGPRTPEGKRRIVLNALKHGERSRDFLSTLLKGASSDEKRAYLDLYLRLERLVQPATEEGQRKLDSLVRELWCTQRLLSRGLNRPEGEDSPSKPISSLASVTRRISVRSGIRVVVPWGQITLHLCLRRGRGPNRQGTRWPRRASGSDGNRRRTRVYWTVRIYRHKARSAEAWLASQAPPATPGTGQREVGTVGQAEMGSKE